MSMEQSAVVDRLASDTKTFAAAALENKCGLRSKSVFASGVAALFFPLLPVVVAARRLPSRVDAAAQCAALNCVCVCDRAAETRSRELDTPRAC